MTDCRARRRLLTIARGVMFASCVVLGLYPVAASASPHKADASQSSGGTLVIGVPSPVLNWDPHSSTSIYDQQIAGLVYTGLTTRDPRTEQIVGELAQSWTVSPDGLTWTFYLRKNAKFNNGAPVTATDVQYSIQRILNPKTAASLASDLSPISSVGVVNPSTVAIRLKYKYSLLPIALAEPLWGAIIPANSGPTITSTKIGAGPFMVKSIVPQASITLVPNPYYWSAGEPKLAEVIFRVIPDEASRIEALASGQINMDINIAYSDIGALKGNPALNVAVFPSSEVDEFGFNTSVAPFNNVLVRDAVAYAINRSAVAAIATSGFGGTDCSMVSPSSPIKVKSKCFPYNPTKARQLLAQAGYPHGFNLTFSACDGTGFPSMVDAGQVIASDLDAIGVNAKFVTEDAGLWVSQVITTHDYQGFVCGLIAGLDPDEHTYPYFDSDGAYNFSLYKPPAILDNLLAEARQVTSNSQRSSLYTQAWQILDNQVPWIPLYWGPGVAAMTKNVKGFEPLAEENLNLNTVTVSS